MNRKALVAGGLFVLGALTLPAVRFSKGPEEPAVIVDRREVSEQHAPAQPGAASAPKNSPDMSFPHKAAFEQSQNTQLLGPDFLDVFHQIMFHHYGLPREQVMDALDEWMGRYYTDAEAAQIRDAFVKYLDLVDRMQDPRLYAGATTMREKYERIMALRREILGGELADALFREEELEAEYALGVNELYQDENLPEAERRNRLAELEGSLPEDVRRRVVWKDPRTEYHEELRELRDEAGELSEEADAELLHDLRIEHFGEEAARRLADLDRKRAERAQRRHDYQQARQDLLSDPRTMQMSEEEYQERLQQLRVQHLEPEEYEEARARDLLGGLGSREILELIDDGSMKPVPDAAYHRGER